MIHLMKTLGLAVEIWLALFLACQAAPLTSTDQEQQTILAICRIAAKSTIIGDEDTAGIAQFCVAWKTKMQAAEQKAKEEPKVEDTQK